MGSERERLVGQYNQAAFSKHAEGKRRWSEAVADAKMSKPGLTPGWDLSPSWGPSNPGALVPPTYDFAVLTLAVHPSGGRNESLWVNRPTAHRGRQTIQ
jgi:hypothetical protein